MESIFFIWAVAASSLLAAVLFTIKSIYKKDYTVLMIGVANTFLFIATAILLVYKDSTWIPMAVLSILVAEITNMCIWFLSKKYREELESKIIIGTLKAVQDRYTALVENSLVGIYIFDANGKIEYVNSTLASLLGFRPYELIGKNVYDLIYPDDVITAKENVRKRINGLSPVIKYDLRMIRKDGKIVKVTVMGSLTRNGHDTISGTLLLAE